MFKRRKMKQHILKETFRYLVVPIAAGLVVGTITSQCTMDYLDNKLNQMIVEQQGTSRAGVIAAVSQMEKSAKAPYRKRAKVAAVAKTEDVAHLTFTDKESQILLKLAMAEAEDQGVIGKALVMSVVHNRIMSDDFPDTIEDVVFEANQFTPISDGRFKNVVPDSECYEALEMITNYWDGSNGALYFEADYSKATWHSNNLTELFTYGDVTFYK